MKTFLPQHLPVEYAASAYNDDSPRNGHEPTNRTGISRFTRRNGSEQSRMAAHHPVSGSALMRKLSGSFYPVLILFLGLVALLVTSSSVNAQMSGDLELALSMHKAGKLRDAIEFYSEAIRKNPKSAEAFNWRGIAYDDLGETDKAFQDFNEAIEVNNNYADAYNNRGEIYRKKKMYREALNDYSKAVQLEPTFAEAYYNLAMVSELENRPGPAAANYENYLKNKPDAPDKSEIESKIKALRQAAASMPRPGAPPVAQKPGESKPAAPPQPAAKPTAPEAAKPATPPKPPMPGAVGGTQTAPGMPKPGMPGMQPVMPNIPGMPPGISPDMLVSMMTGIGILGVIIDVVLYLFTAFMLFLIAKKTNTNLPWLAFIPIAQIVLALNIARKPLWWFLLLLLPVAIVPLAMAVGFDPTGGTIVTILAALIFLIWAVVILFVCIGIARARGKSVIWGILLFLFPCVLPGLIALGYLGLSE